MASFFSSGLDDRFNNSSRSSRISDPPSFNPSYSREPAFGSATRVSTINPTAALNDSRNLHRRFTTSYSSLAQQRRSAFDTPAADIFAFQPSLSPADKKKYEYEQLKQKRMERQRRLDMLNQESHREELELARLSQELGMGSSGAGHQSEPTTPPEYRDAGFPNSLSRPNRFSAGNLIAPSSLFKAGGKSDGNLTSPPTERARAYNALTAAAPSVPHSKNNSDEEDSPEEVLDFNHRSAASFNRNSMPVTRRDLSTNGDPTTDLGHVNTHRFLFGDDDNKGDHHLSTTPRPKSFFHQTDKDDFPVLLKRNTNGNMQYSTGSSALDMSSADESDHVSAQASKRSSMQRAYPSQSMSGFGYSSAHLNSGDSPPFGLSQANAPESFPPPSQQKSTHPNRHSLGAGASLSSTPRRPGLIASPSSTMAEVSGTPKLQQSYSTNDIPTVKSVGNSNGQGQPSTQYAHATAEQRLHSHNLSLGRIPQASTATAVGNKRHSRELSSSSGSQSQSDEPGSNIMQSIGAVLHSGTSTAQQPLPQVAPTSGSEKSSPFSTHSQTSSAPFSQQGYGTGYSIGNQMNMLSTAMGGLNTGMGGPQQWNPQAQHWNSGAPYNPQSYQGYNSFHGYGGGSGGGSRFSDTQSQRSSRRGQGSDDGSRVSAFRLEELVGEILGLCTDQNGCRFLQKKLEEGNSQNVQLIFNETKDHMFELMTDPFGNYLVQKLLEHTQPEHHTLMINDAAKNMVKIALNQHGTRALQKMIEYIVEPQQIDTLVQALSDQVVPMIQDLNGNHVIQKCLNRLSAPSIQFIIDAVSQHCIVVGTHRHGCCVIQRCIDHATPEQKAQLVSAITSCSLPLVQDPFGNYVLQYIFDQGEASFSQLLCRTFLGRIAELSKQKFSSNVIEKCIRIADADVKHEMIVELLSYPDFDRVADDAFANYVIQTAWDHANEEDEDRLAEKIRPVLPRMRHKPYGRRFASRLSERDKRLGIGSSAGHSEVSSPVGAFAGMNMGVGNPSFYGAHPDSGYGPGAFGVGSPLFHHSDFSRPGSHHMNTPQQPTFSPMNPMNHQGGYNYPTPNYSAFQHGFGRPSGY